VKETCCRLTVFETVVVDTNCSLSEFLINVQSIKNKLEAKGFKDPYVDIDEYMSPYSIDISHRLLVKGKRIETDEEYNERHSLARAKQEAAKQKRFEQYTLLKKEFEGE